MTYERLAMRVFAILFAALSLAQPAVALWTGQTPLVLVLSSVVGVTGIRAGFLIDRLLPREGA